MLLIEKLKFKLKPATYRLWLVLFILLLAGCGEQDNEFNALNATPATQLKEEITDKYVILALGDSLTEGLGVAKDSNYPALLQAAIHEAGYPQVEVINSGLSGETSSGLLSRVDWVLQLKPDLTILNIGANDAMRGLPLSLTTQNISTVIEKIEATGSDVILAGMQIYDNLGQEYVAGFKDMYPQLANQHDLTLIPFFLEHVAGDASFNQGDMIHPTRAGYEKIVALNVLPVILPVIKQQLNTASVKP